MVNNENNTLKIIREKSGIGTGDVLIQTADGRWWEKWNGRQIGTGEEVRTRTDGELR